MAAVTKSDTPRQFHFRVSDGSVDREGDRLDVHAWDLTEYKTNAVVLWGHDATIPAIARTTAIGVVDEALGATVEFPPPNVFPFADQVCGLLASGYLRAISVGFQETARPTPNEFRGLDYHGQKLLELSIVNIPALAAALVDRRAAGVDRLALAKWLKRRGPDVRTPAASMTRTSSNVATCLKGCGVTNPESFLRQLAGRGEPPVLRLRDERIAMPVGPHELGEMIGRTVGEQVARALYLASGNLDYLPPGHFRR